jgi:hypothetical protein
VCSADRTPAPLGDEPSPAAVCYPVAVPRIRFTSTRHHDGDTIDVPVELLDAAYRSSRSHAPERV